MAAKMFDDMQLSMFANSLGVIIFALIVAYHYLAVNNGSQRPLPGWTQSKSR